MVVIRDPNTSQGAIVDKDGHVLTSATVESELEHNSNENKKSFSWSSGTFDQGVNDTILLVRNNSDDDLHIAGVWLSTDVDTRALIHSPTAVFTIAGTAVAGINLNKTGSNLLTTDTTTADARQNETANVLGDIFWAGEIMGADSPYFVDLQGAVILAKGDSIGVDYVADTGVVDVTIIGHFG